MKNAETDFSGDHRAFFPEPNTESLADVTRPNSTTPKPGSKRQTPPAPNTDRWETPLFRLLRGKSQQKADENVALASEQEKGEVERRRVQELVSRLNSITRDVERAREVVDRADAEFADLKTRRAVYIEKLKLVWGQTPSPFTGAAIPIEQHYMSLAACDAALADFPAARKVLAAAVVAEETKLARFKTENDLGDD